MKITAIIPTRGDVDVSPIVEHLRTYKEIGSVLVVASDTPYSRYEWAGRADTELVYTQDDDCITDIDPILYAWRDGEEIVNAMTAEHAAQYPGRQTLIGFGTLFFRDLISETFGCDLSNTFQVCSHRWKRDELFYREADRIFATMNTHVSVFPKIEILPYASNANRYWKQPDHVACREAMNRRIFEQTGIEAGCL